MRLLVLLLLVAGCTSLKPTDPAPVVVSQPGKEFCPQACVHMATLADGGPCEPAMDIKLKDGGTLTCVQFCTYLHDNGIYWNTTCLTAISSCDQIENCNVTPP